MLKTEIKGENQTLLVETIDFHIRFAKNGQELRKIQAKQILEAKL